MMRRPPSATRTDTLVPDTTLCRSLWGPPFTSHVGENGAPVRRAATSEVADLMTDLVVAGVRPLAFVRSRRGAEAVAATSPDLLSDVAPEPAGRVAPYLGGYISGARRACEPTLGPGEPVVLGASNPPR